MSGLHTDLRGIVKGTLRGESIERAIGQVSLDLGNSTVNAARLTEGSLQAAIEGGRFSVRSSADYTDGRTVVEAGGRIVEGSVEGKLSLDVSFDTFASLLDADTLFPSELRVRGSLEGRWGAPAENQVYADVAGNIGYKPAGLAPVRKNFDGLLPVPGDGAFEWQGWAASSSSGRTRIGSWPHS